MKRQILVNLSMLFVGLILGGGILASAFSPMTGTTTGNVTGTPANFSITAVSDSQSTPCTFTALSYSCTGLSVAQGASFTETITIKNIGTTGGALIYSTSSITPTDATCSAAGPPNLNGGETGNVIVTYTAGQTIGSISCNVTIS